MRKRTAKTAKFDDLQIERGALKDLGDRIAAHLKKVREYEASAREKAGVYIKKAQDNRDTIAQLLNEAKAKCKGTRFKAFKAKYCPNLSRPYIYELLSIGDGRKTVEEVRTATRERVAKSRAAKVSATSPVTDTTNAVDLRAMRKKIVTEANEAVGSVLNKVRLGNDQAVNIDDFGEAAKAQLAKAMAGNTETAEAALDAPEPRPSPDATKTAEASADQREAENADLALSAEERAAKKSAKNLGEFMYACKLYLPTLTEADLKKARVYFMEGTWKPKKAEAA